MAVSAYFLCVDGGSKCLEPCAFVKVAVYIVLYAVVDWSWTFFFFDGNWSWTWIYMESSNGPGLESNDPIICNLVSKRGVNLTSGLGERSGQCIFWPK